MKLEVPVTEYLESTGQRKITPRGIKQFFQARALVRQSWVRQLGVEGEQIVVEIDAPPWFKPLAGAAE